MVIGHPLVRRATARVALGLVALVAGCTDVASSAVEPSLCSGISIQIGNTAVNTVDLLFVIDDSVSMGPWQPRLSQQLGGLIDMLANPPVNPATGRSNYPPVRDLRVGVVSTDLGTADYPVPSCANTGTGDDGLLNPIRNGASMRVHPPWASLPSDLIPARCHDDRDQYPAFLRFTAGITDAVGFREDFVCNALLGAAGCEIEQPLEAAYRALVLHDARERPGNTDPNAGFVRNSSVLGIVVITDEDDASVRDCRFAERGRACDDATSVFNARDTRWATEALNSRFYAYQPGSAQDPTWPLDRYIDPTDPTRGFLSLKPGRPDLVVFAAITGVPISVPMRAGSTCDVDWDALLGRDPSGVDGYSAMSAEGPVSMRQGDVDRNCPARMVPACRLEGTRMEASNPDCDGTVQPFAWPARRIAQVARHFEQCYQTGTVTSICRHDWSGAMQQIVQKFIAWPDAPCFPRALPTLPERCNDAGHPAGCASGTNGITIRVPCVVHETLLEGDCEAAHGRHAAGRDASGRTQCLVDQVPVTIGGDPPPGSHGFFYDTRPDPTNPGCTQRITFTPGDEIADGATATIECLRCLPTGGWP